MIRWFDLVRWLPIVGGSKGGRAGGKTLLHQHISQNNQDHSILHYLIHSQNKNKLRNTK